LTAKLIDRYLNSKGVKTWLVCSETPEENGMFMPLPDEIIMREHIQALIYTPTAQSGLDIQVKFDRGLLIANGVLNPTQMLQMLGRCRQCPEWFVSAPRRSSNPDCLAPSLDGRKVKEGADQISRTFEELGFNAPSKMQGWAVWERLTGEVEKAFNSEYLKYLLEYFFESVDAIETANDRTSQWRRDAQAIKDEDIEKTLKANFQKGCQLIDEQKQPKFNSEVWDVKLAEFSAKYPQIAQKAISDLSTRHAEAQKANAEIEKRGGLDTVKDRVAFLEKQLEELEDWWEILEETLDVKQRIFKQDPSNENRRDLLWAASQAEDCLDEIEDLGAEAFVLNKLLRQASGGRVEEAIALAKLFHSRRLEKLKNYVMAMEPSEQDDRDLIQYLRERPAHYNAGNFKRLQNIKLYRALNLGELAKVKTEADMTPNETAFWAGSAKIAELYRAFLADPELTRLFPLVDSQKALFDAVKGCLTYMGFQKLAKSMRIDTEEVNPNGKDRNGNQRFSQSKSIYFVCWLLMECSGSAYFQQNLELIFQAIRDRLVAERAERQAIRERKERHESPPPRWGAIAA
jgi:hypothetical protein